MIQANRKKRARLEIMWLMIPKVTGPGTYGAYGSSGGWKAMYQELH